jgi:Protein of unknown function (DUF3240)
MSQHVYDLVAVSINVPPVLEESIVDWLLARAGGHGFTAYAAHGHGAAHEHLTIAEQVRGRQRRMEFRVVLPGTALEDFVADLEREFAATDLYFHALPVLVAGHCGATPQ